VSRAYYNEREPYAAQWLRNLIAAGLIASGDVDERDILDVHPSDLKGYAQCHFFAGIGVWSYALRRAGWPDDRRVWTGSCPCQPFSQAGEGLAFDDERHLWPHWFHLIAQRRPPVIFGEQVASKDALPWLDLVHADLEAAGYAVGDADLCAAGVGAPHIRQRLFFVADHEGVRLEGLGGRGETRAPERGDAGLVANDDNGRRDRIDVRVRSEQADDLETPGGGGAAVERAERADPGNGGALQDSLAAGPTNGYWADADWLICRDGKWRPVEPGTFPLAHGPSNRVGRLRAAGNAIVAQVAEEFIRSYLDLTQ
jgi:DNA (cytosine-5)-methyltransferase 1